ncbi:Uncharacterised protein [Salmonella enterica subsp. enterica]|nr:Uncharacterised protein [Salmonella enterica subsp. enterica]
MSCDNDRSVAITYMIIVTIIAIGIQHILKSVVIFGRITVASDSEIGAC